jgi:glycerophosphoryl diester phosphodiesterase
MRRLRAAAFLICWAGLAGAQPWIAVHGHRGARAMRPENTLPAFEYAIEAGVDAVELDLAVTRENALVVSHDPELRRPVCSGPEESAIIRQLTLAQVRQWDCGGARVPTLDEVLALAPRGRFDFNIETKIFPQRPEVTPGPEEFARLVLDAVRRRGVEDRAILQSFDFRTLAAMKRLAPKIRRSALYSGPARDFVEIGREAEAQIVAPEYRLVTAEQVAAAHQAGFKVVPWTVNTREAWETLVAAGVDGIITDDPAGLIAFLRGKGLR